MKKTLVIIVLLFLVACQAGQAVMPTPTSASTPVGWPPTYNWDEGDIWCHTAVPQHIPAGRVRYIGQTEMTQVYESGACRPDPNILAVEISAGTLVTMTITPMPTATGTPTNSPTPTSTAIMPPTASKTPTATPRAEFEHLCLQSVWGKQLKIRQEPSMYNTTRGLSIDPGAIIPIEAVITNWEGTWGMLNWGAYAAMRLNSNGRTYAVMVTCQ